jgi:hypothetical protein
MFPMAYSGARGTLIYEKINYDSANILALTYPFHHTVEPYCLSHFEKAKRIKGVQFVETSPFNYAGASGKGKMFFKQKLYVQIANTHRWAQSHTNTQPMLYF